MALANQPKKDLIINEIKVMRDFRQNNIVNYMDRFALTQLDISHSDSIGQKRHSWLDIYHLR